MDIEKQKALDAFEKRLGIEFKNKLLLIEAVTHRSYLNENPNHPTGNYERLEFLGDSILEFIVREHLLRKFPKANEGEMTDWRSSLVQNTNLARASESFQIDTILFASSGQWKDAEIFSVSRQRIHACVFEALIGAMYLDQGLGTCRLLIDAFINANLTRTLREDVNPKIRFQEVMQELHGVTPKYAVTQEFGQSHAKTFEVSVYVRDFVAGKGSGNTKKAAEVEAAKQALATISTWDGRSQESAKVPSNERLSSKENK